jgi:hypothetical protein
MVVILDTPKAQGPAVLVRTVTGHILITEPQNLVLARQEQVDRAYEELEEAHRR